MQPRNRHTLFALGATSLFLLAVVAVNTLAPAGATHQPADKVAASGASLEILTTPLLEGNAVQTAPILTTSLKTSSPTDLLIHVTLECALWTDITTTGNDEASAMARVKVWVEIDGSPVLVSGDEAGEDAGKVVFCDRSYQRTTMAFDDEDATIESYLRTRSANAFNWIRLNLGSGVHEIVVKAELETQVTGTGMAKAAIGKRTLVVEPAKMANDATI